MEISTTFTQYNHYTVPLPAVKFHLINFRRNLIQSLLSHFHPRTMFFNGVSLVFGLFSDCLINFLANEEKLFARTEKSKSFSYFRVYLIRFERIKYSSNSNNIRKGKSFIGFEIIVEIRILPSNAKFRLFVSRVLCYKSNNKVALRSNVIYTSKNSKSNTSISQSLMKEE